MIFLFRKHDPQFYAVVLGPVRFLVKGPKHRPLFSERNGYIRVYARAFGWRLTA